MIDILLISDQPRLHGILATHGALPDGRLRVANSLHQGMEEIASTAPDILFLQNRLSGLAGYILVRHIREATGTGTTKIILLTEGTQGCENATADIELLTGVSDNELSDAISEIIGDQLATPASAPAAPPNLSVGTRTDPPLPDTDVTDSVSLSQPELSAMRNPLLPASPTRNPDAALSAQATVIQSNPPPIQWEKKRLMYAVTILTTLVVAGLIAAFLFRTPPGKPAQKPAPTAAPGQKAVSPVQRAASSNARTVVSPVQPAISSNIRQTLAPAPKPPASLPSFIQSNGVDSRYPLTNPGWERYTSSTREYKIFRESGAIKAIQVLDRQATGISPAFFSSAIREMTKVRDYRTVSREVQGDFLVKKGKLSKSSELILYKDRSDKILRAFVIYFVPQETIPGNKGSK